MTSRPNRRQMLAAMTALALTGAQAVAQTVGSGTEPIRVIVPLPAGGAADATVRMLVAAMQNQTRQTLIVDNRPGGNFTIGMQAIGRAAPDGLTLLHVNIGMVSTQAAMKKFDMEKALAPISLNATMPAVLVVPAKSPHQTVGDLVAWAKANPGKLNYGSVGIGSMEHLWSSNFAKSQGFQAVHIPFKGMPEASVALVAGDVQALPLIYSVAQPLIQKGLLRPLAMLDTQRHPGMPQVPTLKEAGIDAPPLRFWGGLVAPAGTPAPVIESLRRQIVAATNDADYREKLVAIGGIPVSSETSQSFAKLIADELAWMTKAVKDANLDLN